MTNHELINAYGTLVVLDAKLFDIEEHLMEDT